MGLSGASIDLLLDERRKDEAGTDGIAGDAARGIFESHNFGEPDKAMLGGNIGGLVYRSDKTVHGSDVDDASLIAALHRRKRSADGVKGGRQIDGDDGVPAIRRELLDGSDVLDASVVDEDIDEAISLFSAMDERGALIGVGEVGGVIEDIHVMLQPETLRKRLGLIPSGDAIDDEAASGGGERLREGKADA